MKIRKIFSFIVFLLMSFFCSITTVFADTGVEVKNVRVSEKSGTITVEELNYHDNEITSKIFFNELNDFVTFQIELQNHTSEDYSFSNVTSNLENDYVEIESDKNVKISANATTSVTVKIKYVKQVTNQEDLNLNGLKLNLNFDDGKTITNPKTNNNMGLIIISALIVGAVLFIAKSKTKKKLMILLILLLPLGVFAKYLLTLTISFNDIKVKSIMLPYTITIYDEGGNVEDRTISYGNTVGDLPVPDKNGYTFNDWVDEDENVVTSDTVVKGDMSLLPTYTINNYNVTYDVNGGTIENDNPTTYTVEDEFIINNPSKAGYTFRGWSSDGGATYQTSAAIYKGTTGDKNYVAYYSPNPDTKYTVIHEVMNLNGEYEVKESEELHGATDTTVSPQPKEYVGFITPEVQSLVIAGDGSASITYKYERIKYSFEVTDRTYVTSSSTVNGNYYYNTSISVTANERVGYTFKWSDGETDLSRSFKITDNVSLTPIYTAITDIPYKVVHKQMNLDGSTYSVKDESTFYGTTDTSVTPTVNTYEGFTSPSTKTVTIFGDGSTVVEYKYTRNKYQLTIEDDEYVTSNKNSGKYYYGTEITLTAKERDEYNFVKWSNNDTSETITFNLYEDTTIGPIYEKENAYTTTTIKDAYWGGNDLEGTQSWVNYVSHPIIDGYRMFEDVTSIERSDTNIDPNNGTYREVSTDDSEYELWFWIDNNTLYYYTAATTVKLNKYTGYLFRDYKSLTDISVLADWDWSQVRETSYMFANCESLEDISALSSMSQATELGKVNAMFDNCSSLSDITALADWDVSNVGTIYENRDREGNHPGMGYLFSGTNVSDYTSIANWDVSKVTKFSHMFNKTPIMKSGLSAFNNWIINTDSSDYTKAFTSTSLVNTSVTFGNKTFTVSN